MFLLGAGAKVYGEATLATGIIAASLIIPVFLYRHYVTDKGEFPAQTLADLAIANTGEADRRKAGILPYVTLIAGAAIILVATLIFR